MEGLLHIESYTIRLAGALPVRSLVHRTISKSVSYFVHLEFKVWINNNQVEINLWTKWKNCIRTRDGVAVCTNGGIKSVNDMQIGENSIRKQSSNWLRRAHDHRSRATNTRTSTGLFSIPNEFSFMTFLFKSLSFPVYRPTLLVRVDLKKKGNKLKLFEISNRRQWRLLLFRL